MTIDPFDDVLMPLTIGLLIGVGFLIVGFLFYLLLNETLIAAFFILCIIMTWAIGFPIWRHHKYG